MTTPPGLERRPLLSCSTSTLLWLRVPLAWTLGGAWSVLGEGGQVRQCAMPPRQPTSGSFQSLQECWGPPENWGGPAPPTATASSST